MKNRILALMCTLALITPLTQANPGGYQHIPALQLIPQAILSDVEAFKADVKKNGLEKYMQDLNGVEMNPLIAVGLDPLMPPDVLGLCWKGVGYIEFNSEILKLEPTLRRYTVYHELFHCTFGLDHIEGTLMAPTAPRSITPREFAEAKAVIFNYIREEVGVAKKRSEALDDYEHSVHSEGVEAP